MPPSQEASQREKIEQIYAKNDLQTAPETKEDNESRLKSPLFIPSTMKEFVDEIWYASFVALIRVCLLYPLF